VRSIRRVRAGYGKVAVLDELGQRLGIATDRTIYVGDGSSDIHVMLHVNNGDGFTIAVSENRQLARIARSTVLSDNAGSVLVPIADLSNADVSPGLGGYDPPENTSIGVAGAVSF
jgi:3-deoxy-D-manno-octulosonate 8-phosphate phosphatase KdsC-like HAD superfamily phosphatase